MRLRGVQAAARRAGGSEARVFSQTCVRPSVGETGSEFVLTAPAAMATRKGLAVTPTCRGACVRGKDLIVTAPPYNPPYNSAYK